MAEYLTLDDGSKIQVISRGDSINYVVPLGKVYYDRFARCEGTYEAIDPKDPEQKTKTNYGSFIEDRDEEYAVRLKTYIDALIEHDEQLRQGQYTEKPNPPELPEFKNWKLLENGQSVKLEVIEKTKEGYAKNIYTIKNENFGQCSKTLEESTPVTKEGYDYFVQTGKILPISQITPKDNNKSSGSFIEEKNIILPIIIGSVVLIGIISIILYMNKNKKRGK